MINSISIKIFISKASIKDAFASDSRSWELNKFETFNQYLRVQNQQVGLLVGFMVRRLSTVAVLCLNGIVIYGLHLQNPIDSFICSVKNLPEIQNEIEGKKSILKK